MDTRSVSSKHSKRYVTIPPGHIYGDTRGTPQMSHEQKKTPRKSKSVPQLRGGKNTAAPISSRVPPVPVASANLAPSGLNSQRTPSSHYAHLAPPGRTESRPSDSRSIGGRSVSSARSSSTARLSQMVRSAFGPPSDVVFHPSQIDDRITSDSSMNHPDSDVADNLDDFMDRHGTRRPSSGARLQTSSRQPPAQQLQIQQPQIQQPQIQQPSAHRPPVQKATAPHHDNMLRPPTQPIRPPVQHPVPSAPRAQSRREAAPQFHTPETFARELSSEEEGPSGNTIDRIESPVTDFTGDSDHQNGQHKSERLPDYGELEGAMFSDALDGPPPTEPPSRRDPPARPAQRESETPTEPRRHAPSLQKEPRSSASSRPSSQISKEAPSKKASSRSLKSAREPRSSRSSRPSRPTSRASRSDLAEEHARIVPQHFKPRQPVPPPQPVFPQSHLAPYPAPMHAYATQPAYMQAYMPQSYAPQPYVHQPVTQPVVSVPPFQPEMHDGLSNSRTVPPGYQNSAPRAGPAPRKNAAATKPATKPQEPRPARRSNFRPRESLENLQRSVNRVPAKVAHVNGQVNDFAANRMTRVMSFTDRLLSPDTVVPQPERPEFFKRVTISDRHALRSRMI